MWMSCAICSDVILRLSSREPWHSRQVFWVWERSVAGARSNARTRSRSYMVGRRSPSRFTRRSRWSHEGAALVGFSDLRPTTVDLRPNRARNEDERLFRDIAIYRHAADVGEGENTQAGDREARPFPALPVEKWQEDPQAA